MASISHIKSWHRKSPPNLDELYAVLLSLVMAGRWSHMQMFPEPFM